MKKKVTKKKTKSKKVKLAHGKINEFVLVLKDSDNGKTKSIIRVSGQSMHAVNGEVSISLDLCDLFYRSIGIDPLTGGFCE